MDQRFEFQQSFLRVAAAAAIAGAGYTAGAILPAALVHAEPSGGGSDSRTSSSGGTSDKHHVSGGADSDSASKTSQNSQTRAKVGEAGAGGAAPGSSSSKDRASGGPGSPGASKDDKNGPVGAKVGAPNAAREARNEGSSDVAGVGVTAFRKDTPGVGVLGSAASAAAVQPSEKSGRGLGTGPKSSDRSAVPAEKADEAQTTNIGAGYGAVSSAVVAARRDALAATAESGSADSTENLRGRSTQHVAAPDTVERKIESKALHLDGVESKAPAALAVTKPAVTMSAVIKDNAKPVMVSAPQGTVAQAPVAASEMVSASPAAEVLVPVAPVRPLPIQPSAPLPAPLAPPAPSGVATATASTAPGTRKRAESSGDSVVQPDKERVLILGIDGVRLDKVLEADTPNIDRLMREGTTGPSNLRGHLSLSNPSWTTQLTGVWDDKTGLSSNTFTPETYEKFPSVFTHIETAKPDLRTSSISNWGVIRDISKSGTKPADDVKYFSDDDPTYAPSGRQVADETVKRIRNGDSDFILSYDQQVDAAGHGYGADSPEYTRAIERVDENIGKIMDAIRERESTTGEKWTVILTTDHGHNPEGYISDHGLQSPNETSTFTIVRGKDFGPGEVNPQFSNADTTPTILKTLGVPLSPNFDGVDLRTLRDHALKPSDLETAIRDIINTNHDPDLLTAIRLDFRYFANFILENNHELLDTIVSAPAQLADKLAQARIPVISQVAHFVATVLRVASPAVAGAINIINSGASRAIQLIGAAVIGTANLLNEGITRGMQLADTVADASIPVISPAAAFVAATLKTIGTVVTGVTNLFNDSAAGAIRLIADANIPLISPGAAFVAATFQSFLKAAGTVATGAKDLRSALITALSQTIGWLTGVQPSPPSTAPTPQQSPNNQTSTPQSEPNAA
ncbi:alkaline phosphatase family protein [Mycobacteroides abscessus]|uniref:alkaline phosphatase family protein n=1 Tax=Mycobacteroides abscessus TaxID=36809 RepID=UPI0012FFD879|nr:alkaline phosphatase family protein [Mycobacteroides abscessus]MBE5460168.1 hypothetical protein [Mycobacteroides abscessus]QOF43385.1 hypothetical protein E3G69_002429 [Mycobacteroides abscessus]QOF48084.1 hypothetical protein E3G70_002428 [Mycobacteroides abscessus]